MPLTSTAAPEYSFISGFSHGGNVHGSEGLKSLYSADAMRRKLNREVNSKGEMFINFMDLVLHRFPTHLKPVLWDANDRKQIPTGHLLFECQYSPKTVKDDSRLQLSCLPCPELHDNAGKENSIDL
jgi:hypothetical protein